MLSIFAKVQRVALIVFYGELACSPGGVMYIFHQRNSVVLEFGGRRRGIVGHKVEMEVLALIHKLDRRIFLV